MPLLQKIVLSRKLSKELRNKPDSLESTFQPSKRSRSKRPSKMPHNKFKKLKKRLPKLPSNSLHKLNNLFNQNSQSKPNLNLSLNRKQNNLKFNNKNLSPTSSSKFNPRNPQNPPP